MSELRETDVRPGELIRRVLLTGAAGNIGQTVSPALDERWELLRTDLRPQAGIRTLDVRDLDACRVAFAGVDAVVHLAAEPSPAASWDELLPANVIGAYNVVQAAIDAQVSRLVLASSIQAVSAYAPGAQILAADPPRPANLYGATKGWVESLGAWAAAVSSTSVVALRIGYFAERPPAGSEAIPANLSAWLSPADCSRLVVSAVEVQGVRFIVAHGVSANRHLRLELDSTRAAIGYAPEDDAWEEQ